jgi:hypothetical protein
MQKFSRNGLWLRRSRPNFEDEDEGKDKEGFLSLEKNELRKPHDAA